MVLRETGTILLKLTLMRMPIKYGRPRVNAKPYRPNICADNYAAKYSAGPVLGRARVSAA